MNLRPLSIDDLGLHIGIPGLFAGLLDRGLLYSMVGGRGIDELLARTQWRSCIRAHVIFGITRVR
ncbi:MAG: hypothetical protein DWQ09_01685 [Proteobacteria bacterium]|nr:MAG: hypothetical protein DWQ09_01685 [Pseudomonadota bacterium]